nr:heat stress transcription factor A-1-like [Ipomoea batatas]GMD25691.1 heat stress transcription factor A-1-like [Ipomoea batatas]GMD49507.1 heat stress transcription factor A-1-like [Ipomoea batatas]GMD55038.1 heat stress transcription factor A-1-like [Ipomoea batatas]GME11922.1 heat stress transcription factor A-1-like [Ipomoea batatas]
MDGGQESAAAAAGNSPPPFLSKTYDMVEDPSTDAVVSWSKSNNSFVVWNVPEFAKDILPKYFKHNNFSSFVRQLNTYGFRKVDPDRWEFANEGFLRGHRHLLKSITRRKHVQSHQQAPQVQNSSVGSCVEVGKFGLEEEVDRLKRDKNILMQELVKLRQQQQATDHQLQNVGQKVHMMEQRQQQMMSFLAKAMQSPSFVAQMVHQQSDNMRISGVNKKRRLPNQEEENFNVKPVATLPDGQIVRFQPLMNEAAKSLLRQILKINASARLEPKFNNTSGFLTDNTHSTPNVLDSGDTANHISGVSLSEVLPTPSMPHLASETGLAFNHHPTSVSQIQPSSGVMPNDAKVTKFPEMNALSSKVDKALSNFFQAQGHMTDDNANHFDRMRSESQDVGYIDTPSGFVDDIVPDGFSSDPDIDVLMDEMPKLPGINDVFWDQILSASPLTGDTDDINSVVLENGVEEHDLQTEDVEWDKLKHMSHLTEQMGLLASGSSNAV